jgi:hypothetical protein
MKKKMYQLIKAIKFVGSWQFLWVNRKGETNDILILAPKNLLLKNYATVP